MDYSTEEFAQSAYALQRFLRSSGLRDGERVAVFCGNCPQWHIADFGTMLAGLVVVPIYSTLAADQLRFQLEHSGSRAILFGGQYQWDVLQPLLTKLPNLEALIELDRGIRISGQTALSQIVSATSPPSSDDWQVLRRQADSLDPDTTATIVYTSGTTATPKGVPLSHRNILCDLDGCLKRLQFRTTAQALSVLPLSHVFERLLCYGYFSQGVPIAYGEPRELGTLLPRHRPSVMGCVPRILERIRETVEAQIQDRPDWVRRVATGIIESGLERGSRISVGKRPSLGSNLMHLLGSLVLYSRIRSGLGNLGVMVCGGSRLDPSLEIFFRAIGLKVLQGYGMTETAPVVCLNDWEDLSVGTVGRPLDGIELRIAGDGEILVRGAVMMKHYHQDEAATKKAIVDGWLHTGDIGAIDAVGRLSVTGRKRENLVLSTGKKVSCPAVETVLRRSPLIEDAFLVGEGRKFICAILVPSLAAVKMAAAAAGVVCVEDGELLRTDFVAGLYRRELILRQAELTHYERAKRFCLLAPEWLQDPELFTPTLKLRRTVLESKYQAWIDRMYVTEDPLVIPPPSARNSRAAAG